MYAFLKGIIEEKNHDCIMLDVNGVGYLVLTTRFTIDNIGDIGHSVKILTYLYIREDIMSLYGFLTKEEKNMFGKLISVSGIGPKGAMGILSTLNAAQLAIAIVTSDISSLIGVPGIGRKTAQRLVLELKEKIMKEDSSLSYDSSMYVKNDSISEAIHALIALGYSHDEADNAVITAGTDKDSVEELIKKALRNMDKLRK